MPAIEHKKYAICIFLDYSACFDTICRDIILRKLDRYGVRGMSYNFVASYFTNREQQVKYGSSLSSCRVQSLGVVQGSKTGPLFWDIYSADFNALCPGDESILYADDTCLVYVGDSLEELTNRANMRLTQIYEWCNFNKLSVNPSKSEFMLVTNKMVNSTPQLFIGGSEIKKVNCFKYIPGCPY